MNVAQLTAAIKDFLRPLAGEARSGERTEQLNNLGNVVIVFTVLSAGLGIKKVIAGNEFKNLKGQQRFTKNKYASERVTGERKQDERFAIRGLTMAAMLQTSVLAPHLAPRITSGDLYCLV